MSTLKEIIEKSLEVSSDSFPIESSKIERWIKDEAKKLFFNGRIQLLVSFLQSEKAEDASLGEDWQLRLPEEFPSIPKDFIVKMHQSIRKSIPENEPVAISSLLRILDYQHLEGFLKMFGI